MSNNDYRKLPCKRPLILSREFKSIVASTLPGQTVIQGEGGGRGKGVMVEL